MRLPVLALLAAVAAVALAAIPSRAQPPAFPQFTTVYGNALADGENLAPREQPLVAFVNGRACGWSATRHAPDEEGASDLAPDDEGEADTMPDDERAPDPDDEGTPDLTPDDEGEADPMPDDEDAPTPDPGRTVYAVDARSDGDGLYQLPGCGAAGDAVLFYLPEGGRMAVERARFGGDGAVRADLSFDVRLSWRLRAPQLANDGALP